MLGTQSRSFLVLFWRGHLHRGQQFVGLDYKSHVGHMPISKNSWRCADYEREFCVSVFHWCVWNPVSSFSCLGLGLTEVWINRETEL